jgi:hypothetical protein
MDVTLGEHTLTAKAETGDMRVSNESHLLHRIKLALIAQGHDVIKKRMWRDGHLMDDQQQYIRERKGEYAIYDGQYALRDLAVAYRQDGHVSLMVER